MYDGTGTAIPPSQYAQMDADLGNPLSSFQSRQVGSSIGYQLFWRMYDGGVVYFNWTGSTTTVSLPTDRVYYNTSGAVITQLTIADGAGAYARTTAVGRAARPSISPRFGAPVQGPISVTMKSDTPGAAIYYTLNGSTPTPASTKYTGSFALSTSATIKAIAVASGYANSTVTTAAYTVNGAVPHVNFALASDSGPAVGTAYPVLTLDAVPNPTAPVTVHYTVTQPNGSTTSGSASFNAGDTYRYFPVPTSTQNNATTYVRITSATNAALGSVSQFSYTVGSGGGGSPVAPSAAAIVSPPPGSKLPGSAATFSWNTRSGVSEYFLQVGTTGAGSFNIYSMPEGTSTSQVVNGLPSSGTVYVRLWSNLGTPTAVNWQYNDYTFQTGSGSVAAAIVSPVPGSTVGLSATFSWNTGSGVSEYFLQVGTTGAGSFNIYSMPKGNSTSQMVNGLPSSGTVYVRLWSNLGTAALVNWQYNDYTYQAASGPSPASMISPVPGSTVSGTAATFQWNTGNGVSQYFLQVGTTGAGSFNIYSMPVGGTSQVVNGLPTSGSIYVRLWSNLGTSTAVNWKYYDYTYNGGR